MKRRNSKLGKNRRPKRSGRSSGRKPRARNQAAETGEARSKGEWVKIEWRNQEGKLMLPRREVVATGLRKFDPKQHTDLALWVLPDYAPAGALLGQYKLYDISCLDLDGWIRRAVITVEIPPTNGHEEEWFSAYAGQRLSIVGSRDGVTSVPCEMKVQETKFEKKVISSATDSRDERYLYEARLKSKELWRSAYRRHQKQLAKAVLTGAKWILITAVGAAIVFAVQQILEP